jgi:hypothetical protein
METPDASVTASSSSSSSSSSGSFGDGASTTDGSADDPDADASLSPDDTPSCGAMEVVCAGACCRGFCAGNACKKPILWLRGDDAVAGSTFTWPDRSGIGNDPKQTTDSLKPTIQGTLLNGHKVLRFPNSARLVSLNAFQPGTGDIAWFHVSSNLGSNAVDKNQVFGTLLDTNPFSGITAGFDSQNHPYGMLRESTDVFFTGSSFATTGAFNVIDMRRAGGNAELRKNGASLATGAATMNLNGGQFVIGSERATGTEFFNGDIAEIVLFATSFTNAERSSVAQQLGTRYGIAVQ